MLMTVVICTYARPELLKITLGTLSLQTLNSKCFEICVIDNAGLKEVRIIAEEYGARYYNLAVRGLSEARNLGYKVCETEWVLYLDDDIKAPPDLLARFYNRMLLPYVDVLGGRYLHWFATQPPRWLRRYYGEGREPIENYKWGELPDHAMLSGNILAARRTVLLDVGGFRTNKGMSGRNIGWGEDDHFQMDARAKGYRIFYDPELWLYHLVQPYKYTIENNLRMAYAMGRDVGKYRNRGAIGVTSLIVAFGRALLVTFPHTIFYLVSDRGYQWQNMVVDVLSKFSYAWGRFNAPPSEQSPSAPESLYGKE